MMADITWLGFIGDVITICVSSTVLINQRIFFISCHKKKANQLCVYINNLIILTKIL